jgi:AraC family transcriptional regulator
MNAPRAEYVARINRVMDYIDDNLGRPLTLAELASVAGFSPFYFHRIFGAMVGETLNQYIRRLRVERAALQLVADPRRPITTIALECGFSGSAPFARAFRDTFGMSASTWRQLKATPASSGFLTNGPDDKDRQSLRKTRQAWEVSPVYIDGAHHRRTWRVTMSQQGKLDAQIDVREEPAFTVAYVRHTGPYQGDGELFGSLFGRLMKWAGPRGLLGSETKTITVYHDDPGVTDPDKLRISVGVSVPDDTKVDGEIGKMTIAGGTYAFARFEIPMEHYGEAWDAVFSGWLPESGYQPTDGVCYEQYHNDANEHPEHKCIVSICVPVKPL